MIGKHANWQDCETCRAMEAMADEQRKYLAKLLEAALDEDLPRRKTPDQKPLSAEDVLDAHDNMPDRIPSEWMETKW